MENCNKMMRRNKEKTVAVSDSTDCDNNLDDDLQISSSVILIITFITSFVCYSNTLNADFVYDDHRAILTNQDLRPKTPIINIFYNDFWGTPLSHSGSHKSFRPLCVLTFRLNYYFGKLNPLGYHLLNNLLHSIVSCLFAYVCKKFFHKQWLMMLGGILFSTHPIHTEAVAGIVGRADIGAAMFFLMAIISYEKATSIKDTTSTFWMFSCMFSALCALYTKEIGISVLAVCMTYEVLIVSKCNIAYPFIAIKKLCITGGLHRIVILMLYTIFLVYTRLLVMGYLPPSFSPSDNPAASHPDATTRFLTFMYLPFCNLWLLLYPFHLSYDWSSLNAIPLVESISQYENILSILFYAGLTFIAYQYLKFCIMNDKLLIVKEKLPDKEFVETEFLYDSLNLLIFSMACMILPFLPATNLLFYVGFVIAERILYIPSLGFCLLIVNGLHLLLKYKKNLEKKIFVIMGAILLLFSVRTFIRNYDWMNEEALYKSGLITSPSKSWGNLANIYNKQERFIEAEKAYKNALKIKPTMGDTNYNLGLLLNNLGRYDEALTYFNNAIKYRPSLAAAHLGLGQTLQKIGKKMDALKVFQNAYNISDYGLKDPQAHHTSLTHIRDQTGRLYFELGNYEKAIKVFRDALDRKPSGYEPASVFNMLGQSYSALNDQETAESWFIKSLDSKPDHVPALLTYSKHLGLRNYKKALEMLKKALSLEPKRTETYLIYSTLLKDKGDLPGALQLLDRVFQIHQNDNNVLSQLSSFHRETKNYEEAKKYQIMLKKLRPDDVSILTNLGALHHILGEMDQAALEYKKAYKINPKDQILRDNMKRLERAVSMKN